MVLTRLFSHRQVIDLPPDADRWGFAQRAAAEIATQMADWSAADKALEDAQRAEDDRHARLGEIRMGCPNCERQFYIHRSETGEARCFADHFELLPMT
jgi:hypothetical protein